MYECRYMICDKWNEIAIIELRLYAMNDKSLMQCKDYNEI